MISSDEGEDVAHNPVSSKPSDRTIVGWGKKDSQD
jgi:hypothetical protein